MTYDSAPGPVPNAAMRVYYVNFWPSGRARLDGILYGLGFNTTTVQPEDAASMFAKDAPDAVVVGFASKSRSAATFLANFKACPWYRRIPLIALIDSRDEYNLWRCIEWGCDDAILKPIQASNLRARVRLWAIRGRMRERERLATDQAVRHSQRAAAFAEIIVPLGVAMMAETDFDVLLSTILAEARRFCSAEGGTIYLISEDNALEFKTIVNEALGIGMGGKASSDSPLPPIQLDHDETEEPTHVASYVAVTGKTVNIPDVYEERHFDMAGARAFDQKTGYRTHSLLTIALRDRAGRIIGVLQLVNSRGESGVVPFSDLDQEFIESLSRMAGQALESYRKMSKLRRQANALVVNIDEVEKEKQVESITSSDYFRVLKARAQGLRDSAQPMESAASR